MRLIQFNDETDARRLGMPSDDGARIQVVEGIPTLYAAAQASLDTGQGLEALIESKLGERTLDYQALVDGGRLLPPLDHPDPAHCLVTGTGLTHLGSADARDAMHKKAAAEGEESLSDSMRMFKWGLEGGKPPAGEVGVQPEWFYKGDGSCLAAPEASLAMPAFADDGGEEPELVGLYFIAPDGGVCRLGFAIGNEFSDHVMERKNYLYLAHSKLRACAFGPEIRLGAAPADVKGVSAILRDGERIWEKPFVTGEAHMSHSLANLEWHHFKYALHRRPGDVHVHFFGAVTLSFSDGIATEPGDIFAIEAEGFGRPLRNTLAREEAAGVEVRAL